jgi:hypothetical protein
MSNLEINLRKEIIGSKGIELLNTMAASYAILMMGAVL